MSEVAVKKTYKPKLDKVKLKKYGFKYIVSLVRWIFIICMCYVVLFPLFKQIVLSIMTAEDMYDATVNYIPKHLTSENYRQAWNQLGGWETILNSLVLTIACSVLIVISATLVGYGLARFKFRLNGALFALVIFALVVPADLLFTPRYVMFSLLKLVGDSFVPMICFAITCTGLKCSLSIFLMRQFFKGQPHELEEAAYVDGAGPLRTFINIMLPGAVGMMVTVFLFSFVWQWLDSSYTTIFMQNVSLISTTYGKLNYLWSDSAGSTSKDLTVSLMRNAGIIIIISPLVVLYAFTQRFFVESISRSGLVG